MGPSLAFSCCTCDGDRGHLDDPADGNNGSEDLVGCAAEARTQTDTKHGVALYGKTMATTAGCVLGYDEEGQFFPAYGDSCCNSSRALSLALQRLARSWIEPRSCEFAPSNVCERLNPTSNSWVSALAFAGGNLSSKSKLCDASMPQAAHSAHSTIAALSVQLRQLGPPVNWKQPVKIMPISSVPS